MTIWGKAWCRILTPDVLLDHVSGVKIRPREQRRRASSALLLRLELQNLVARSAEEYVQIAVGLAHDKPRVTERRDDIRQRFLASEICDVAAYTAELEATYRRFWHDWCEAHPSKTEPTRIDSARQPEPERTEKLCDRFRWR